MQERCVDDLAAPGQNHHGGGSDRGDATYHNRAPAGPAGFSGFNACQAHMEGLHKVRVVAPEPEPVRLATLFAVDPPGRPGSTYSQLEGMRQSTVEEIYWRSAIVQLATSARVNAECRP